MPAFLERKLKAQYGKNSTIPYKVMNAMGVMRGSKETAKGRAMDEKHRADVHAKRGHHNVRNASSHSKKMKHI